MRQFDKDEWFVMELCELPGFESLNLEVIEGLENLMNLSLDKPIDYERIVISLIEAQHSYLLPSLFTYLPARDKLFSQREFAVIKTIIDDNVSAFRLKAPHYRFNTVEQDEFTLRFPSLSLMFSLALTGMSLSNPVLAQQLLEVSAAFGATGILNYILTQHPNLHIEFGLYQAIQAQKIKSIELLFSMPQLDQYITQSENHLLLFAASCSNDASVMKRLLSYPSMQKLATEDVSYLQKAILENRLTMAQCFLNPECMPKIAPKLLFGFMRIAIKNKNVELYQLLMQVQGAKQAIIYKENAIFKDAIVVGDYDLVVYLSKFPFIEETLKPDTFLLGLKKAARDGQLTVVKLLLSLMPQMREDIGELSQSLLAAPAPLRLELAHFLFDTTAIGRTPNHITYLETQADCERARERNVWLQILASESAKELSIDCDVTTFANYIKSNNFSFATEMPLLLSLNLVIHHSALHWAAHTQNMPTIYQMMELPIFRAAAFQFKDTKIISVIRVGLLRALWLNLSLYPGFQKWELAKLESYTRRYIKQKGFLSKIVTQSERHGLAASLALQAKALKILHPINCVDSLPNGIKSRILSFSELGKKMAYFVEPEFDKLRTHLLSTANTDKI